MDVKELLYEEINRLGTNFIRKKLSESRENSIGLVDDIMNNCSIIDDGRTLNNMDQVALAESLMHYLLTTMMLPSQRKIKIGDLEVSLVIPDYRNLKKNPEQVLFIQFISPESSDVQGVLGSLRALQPFHQNIWVISYLPVNVPSPLKNYYISKSDNFDSYDKQRFSRIMYDVQAFIDNVKDFHFKVF